MIIPCPAKVRSNNALRQFDSQIIKAGASLRIGDRYSFKIRSLESLNDNVDIQRYPSKVRPLH